MNAIVSMLINGKVCHQTVIGASSWEASPTNVRESIIVKNDKNETIAIFWTSNMLMIAFEDNLHLPLGYKDQE